MGIKETSFEFNELKLIETEKKSSDFFSTLFSIYQQQAINQMAKVLINTDFNPIEVD